MTPNEKTPSANLNRSKIIHALRRGSQWLAMLSLALLLIALALLVFGHKPFPPEMALMSFAAAWSSMAHALDKVSAAIAQIGSPARSGKSMDGAL